MPPPARPNAATNQHANANSTGNAGFGVTWNNEFMDQPFGSPHDMTYNLGCYGRQNASDGGWNDYSPTTSSQSQFDNFGFLQNGPVHNTNSTGFAIPNVDYCSGGMASTSSSPATRNMSWASATSTSTVESQPSSWAQPRRSNAYANPREATAVLHKMMNTEGADASTRIDIFGTPPNNAGMQNTFDQSPAVGTPTHSGLDNFDMDIDGGNSLFVGEPEPFDNDVSLLLSLMSLD